MCYAILTDEGFPDKKALYFSNKTLAASVSIMLSNHSLYFLSMRLSTWSVVDHSFSKLKPFHRLRKVLWFLPDIVAVHDWDYLAFLTYTVTCLHLHVSFWLFLVMFITPQARNEKPTDDSFKFLRKHALSPCEIFLTLPCLGPTKQRFERRSKSCQ